MGREDSGTCEESEEVLQEKQAQGSFSFHFNMRVWIHVTSMSDGLERVNFNVLVCPQSQWCHRKA